MANERKTEILVREDLRRLCYYDEANSTRVEEQKSEIEAIRHLLKTASKTGKGGGGIPEFIISSPETPDFLVIVECKADTKHHESTTHNDPVNYAVDGALHYALYLSKEFNVIAVAVSGQTRSQMKVSTFLHPKGADKPKVLTTKTNKEIVELIPWQDYIEHGTFDQSVQTLRLDELMAFSHDLHNFMRDYAKLTEGEKPLLVSGTLIALQNAAFAKSYDAYKPDELQRQWLKVISEEIEKAELPSAKKSNMNQPYSTIAVHPELGKATPKFPKGILYELIHRLNEKVWPFVSIYHDFDVVGQFYGEFLKYTGGDKKALGIVLTPRHITDLFARLANVGKESTVLDICAGTGGFLVSAMHHMIRQATTQAEKERIKKQGLIGVENQPNMYALAASNMLLRGDGKANLHQGSCFDPRIGAAIKKYHADVGMLNPPYSQGDADLHELVFVKQLLDCLKPGAIGIVIVPMSCAISPHPLREELMRFHTLEAVMSMPDDLFYPVGTVTCIMIWSSGTPHAVSNRKTWFGYWKKDGFVKTKHRGRMDLNHKWERIRDHWVESFRNREVYAGESVMQKVTHEDEWCAEAYMETDYSKIKAEDFERVVRNYAIFKLLGGTGVEEENGTEKTDD
ncbi:MAG: N-6 DNA methylase [Chloroflexi bacterium]|nr:N-6 DNA methylase [Chloroflexota bacterium]